ncbi:MAG: presqualene diphosphate synthase HpnD [Zoogloeaceae bacterium]|jgi:phytoene synthase|nr:presqualene diphosphate synthase HpnD [Zoogloeaceae bacterium]
MSPDAYCQKKAAGSGSSFYYSFLFLPPERRRAITALYAFCREVDDVVDEYADPRQAHEKLAGWRAELAETWAGRPSHPVTLALAAALRDFALPRELLAEIIDGMEMDLTQHRYADFKALRLYCYRVASTVGLLAAEIFGYTDRRTLKYAHDLGLAFQLTNIIRDVGEDARRGRIYLPADELERFGVRAEDILQTRYSDAFRRLIEFQIERAEGYYAQALARLPAQDRRAQRPGLAMAAIYRVLLHKIRRQGCRVLDRRATLPPAHRLWLAWRAWRAG